ncbi:MipA/OmpV family protein [Serratia aquatilis]|uniref:MipA/OmpV family protein n=1 Tax=Serratia aquatilis TaxID=1737515 RepID=A0ABV6EEP8_9GAMM
MKCSIRLLIALSYSFPLLILSGFCLAESGANNVVFSVGTGIVVAPKCLGSEKLETSPIIHLSYDFGNGFLASTTEGVGFNYIHPLDNGITLSAGTTFNYQQERKDEDELKGMGKIKSSVFNRLDVGIGLYQHIVFHAGANITLSERDHGANYYLSVSIPVLRLSEHAVSIKSTGYYFDRKFSQTYFGVTNDQSIQSKYKEYTPKAGFGQIDTGIEWVYGINKRWSLSSFLGASHLIGESADSPIVKQKTSLQTYIVGIYTF